MKIYVKPSNITGPLGLEALDWDDELKAILDNDPDTKVTLPKEIQDSGEGSELEVWYDSENDRTIVNIRGAVQNHDILGCRGVASGDELIQEFKKYLNAEGEWLGEVLGEAFKHTEN